MSEEVDQAINTLTRDLAKMLVMRRLSRHVNTAVNDHTMRMIESECRYCLDELRLRNNVFEELPNLYASFDYATRSLVLRWAGELS